MRRSVYIDTTQLTMKTVLRHIFKLKRDYEALPFFAFLRDDSLTIRERLSFFPCMAPFILSFGDLNRYVLRDETTIDPHQRMVNEHTYEDDHHWPWYLEDLTKLGHDSATVMSEALRRHYSDDTTVNRLLAMRLASLIWDSPPAIRLAIIEAMEETGNVLFALTSKLAAEFKDETGVELRYCGEFHFLLESGHAMNSDHAALAAIELDSEARQRALQCATLVFDWFGDWTRELHVYALAQSAGAVIPSNPESGLAREVA